MTKHKRTASWAGTELARREQWAESSQTERTLSTATTSTSSSSSSSSSSSALGQPKSWFPFSNASQLPPNDIRKVFGLMNQFQAEGIAINSFAIGQPHLAPSSIQITADNPIATKTGYAPQTGYDEVREVGAAFFQSRYPAIETTKHNIMITAGASGALSLVIKLLINSGDKVLSFAPAFAAYQGHVLQNVSGSKLILMDVYDTNYKPDPERLRDYLGTYEPKLIIFNNHSNPTGIALTRAEMEAFAEVLREFPKVMVLEDATYHDLAVDPDKGLPEDTKAGQLICPDRSNIPQLLDVAPDLADRVFWMTSTSKGLLGDPGFRVSLLRAPQFLIDPISKQPVCSNGQPVDVVAALATLQLHDITQISREGQAKLYEVLQAEMGKSSEANNAEQIRAKNMRLLSYWDLAIAAKDQFKEAEFSLIREPAGGFFMFVTMNGLKGRLIPSEVTTYDGRTITDLPDKLGFKIIKTDQQAALYLMHVGQIALVPGSGFGMPAEAMTARLSTATTDEKMSKLAEQVNYAKRQLLQVEVNTSKGSAIGMASQ